MAHIPADKLGVGMMNREGPKAPGGMTGMITEEGWIARFHALHTKLANESMLNLYVMMIADEFLPWVGRWKSNCAGCPNAGSLSCYEPKLAC